MEGYIMVNIEVLEVSKNNFLIASYNEFRAFDLNPLLQGVDGFVLKGDLIYSELNENEIKQSILNEFKQIILNKDFNNPLFDALASLRVKQAIREQLK